MPKHIKKKAIKKVKPEEELKGSYEQLKNYLEERRKRTLTYSLIAVGVFVVILVVWGFLRYENKKSVILDYTGYKDFYGMDTADKRTEEERYKAALEEYRKAYEAKKSPVSLFYVAASYEKLKDLQKAEATLLDLNGRYGDSMEILPLSYYKLYEIYLARGDNAKALDALTKLSTLNTPMFKDLALLRLAQMLAKEGKKDDAKAKYEELVKNYPDTPYYSDAKDALKEYEPPAKASDAKEGNAAPVTPQTKSDKKTHEKKVEGKEENDSDKSITEDAPKKEKPSKKKKKKNTEEQ